MTKLTTMFLLLCAALSAQAQKAVKLVDSSPKLKMNVSLAPVPDAGTVSLAGDSKVIISLDGATKISVPRVDLSKPTLTATVSANVYTYTLVNAPDALQNIDMVLFPDANFVSVSVNDKRWITTEVGISALGGKGLIPGQSLTFTAVAPEGAAPGLTAAEVYAFVTPSQATAQAIYELESNNTQLADLVAKESGQGVKLQVVGPAPQ